MSTSEGLKDLFRDDTRDRVCETPQSRNMSAQMAQHGRPEEKVGLRPYFESLGIIDVAEGLVRWVNVIRKRIAHITEYYLNYCIPDPRLDPSFPQVLFKSELKRKFILFGKISALTWEGKDSCNGVINRLNGDNLLKETVIKSKVVFTLAAYGKGGYWIISSSYDNYNIAPRYFPSEDEWSSCQLIAQHILANQV